MLLVLGRATGTTEGSDTFGSEPLLAAADAGTPEARGSAGTPAVSCIRAASLLLFEHRLLSTA